MAGPSSLTVEQRAAAIKLFDDGWARRSVATRLGVSVWAVGRLYDLWRVRGGAALVRKRRSDRSPSSSNSRWCNGSWLVRRSSTSPVSSTYRRRDRKLLRTPQGGNVPPHPLPQPRGFTTTLDDYITWFNTSRGHSHCEVLSPVQYRAQTLAA
ncbi:IS3 family transposase [Saccharopolyspora hattusasensis]|uniref:IS3 family transposase n=1 Tax=Saccharopolyspora hattusasensis TaxID=1128679 RepID=UPI003D955B3A